MKHEPSRHANLKSIRVWKVILLWIVTLGIYPVVWFVKRYRELDEPQPKVPHWIWLVSMGSVTLLTMLALYISAYTADDSQRGAEIAVYGSYVMGILITIGAAWWFSRYALVINRATNTPLSKPLTILLAVFFAPVLAAMTQYAINRPQSERPKLAPLLRQISIVAIVVGLTITLLPIVTNPVGKDVAEFKHEIESLKKTNADYNTCLHKVEEKHAGSDEVNASMGRDTHQAGVAACGEVFDTL